MRTRNHPTLFSNNHNFTSKIEVLSNASLLVAFWYPTCFLQLNSLGEILTRTPFVEVHPTALLPPQTEPVPAETPTNGTQIDLSLREAGDTKKRGNWGSCVLCFLSDVTGVHI